MMVEIRLVIIGEIVGLGKEMEREIENKMIEGVEEEDKKLKERDEKRERVKMILMVELKEIKKEK